MLSPRHWIVAQPRQSTLHKKISVHLFAIMFISS